MKITRLTWLLAALATTAALAAFGDSPTPAPPAPAFDAPGPFAALPPIRALVARPAPTGSGIAGDPFSAAPPPVTAALTAIASRPTAVAPAPTALPALPWQVIGKQFDEQEGWTVFLARGEQTSIVRTGDTLDDSYRIVAIQPPTLTLQHLKQASRRTLDIGDIKE